MTEEVDSKMGMHLLREWHEEGVPISVQWGMPGQAIASP